MEDALYALNSLGNDYMSIHTQKAKKTNHHVIAIM